MGFGEAVTTCFRKYIGFSGRAARSEYWWFVLFSVLVGIGAGILDQIVAPGYTAQHREGPLAAITSLILFLPQLAVLVRRLHDIDRTGWWALAFYLILIVAIFTAIGAAFSGNWATAVLLMLVVFAVCVWAIVWMATKGTAGPNRFGPDPLATNVSGVATAPAA